MTEEQIRDEIAEIMEEQSIPHSINENKSDDFDEI